MFQDMLITVHDRKSLYVENYKSIVDFREDSLIVQGKKGTIKIHGTDFTIEYFTSESMRIKGCVSYIEFCSL